MSHLPSDSVALAIRQGLQRGHAVSDSGTSDSKPTVPDWSLVTEIFDALERAGFHMASDQAVGRAIREVTILARVYSGQQEES